MAVWIGTFAVASRILRHHPESAAVCGIAVAIAVLGFVAALLAIGKLIRAQDEFMRRVHRLALALAFGATALFIFAAEFLQRAGFIDDISLMTIVLVMLGTWWAAILVAQRYYR